MSTSSTEEASNVVLDVENHSGDDVITLQELSQNLKRHGNIRILAVPRVLYGKETNRHKWSGEQTIRRRIAQRNMHVMGNKRAAKGITKPTQGWSLYFSCKVLSKIIEHTNAEIAVQRKNYKGFQGEDDEETKPGKLGVEI